MNELFKVAAYPHRFGTKEHNGWRRPAIAKGQEVYAVCHAATGRFFAYAYASQDAAQALADKAATQWGNMTEKERSQYIDANYKSDTSLLIVSGLTADQIL